MENFDKIIAYDFFRQQGIELLQQLAGEEWTDHNDHDPGITTLEQIAYALTDLSYRINFDIADLMAEEREGNLPEHFDPSSMLSSSPIHLKDWRKILLDTDGVRNAWIYPLDTTSEEFDAKIYYDAGEQALRMRLPEITRDADRTMELLDMKGLYRVEFIPEPGRVPENVEFAIRKRLYERRNLCEDFHLIEPLATKGIEVEAKIEVNSGIDPAELLANIYFVIQDYLSPRIRFYTLQERLETGDPIENIFDGPLLSNGFLDDEELDAFEIRHSVRISDVIRLIMNLEGVKAVNSMYLSIVGSQLAASTEKGKPWEMVIPKSQAPILSLPTAPTAKTTPKVGIELYQNGLPLRVNWRVAREKLQELNQAEQSKTRPVLTQLPSLTGQSREVGVYQSIQHHFPEIYGVGGMGLAPPVTALRLAQARQFKAYLSIFDQVLGNSFQQLTGLSKMFSLTSGLSERTYFGQSLRSEVPNFEPLINWKSFGRKTPTEYKAQLQVMAEGGFLTTEKGTLGDDEYYEEGGQDKIAQQNLWDRKNRLLSHLLARFAEQVHEYDERLKKRLFIQKESLVTSYPQLSQSRSTAFNYRRSLTSPFNQNIKSNVSRLEQRISLLLNFPLPGKATLADLLPADPDGGFHLLEHILLRPGPGDLNQEGLIFGLPLSQEGDRPPLKDPFSLQISFIFPGWLDRFNEVKNPGFRRSVTKTIREETPAHIRIYVQWVGVAEMRIFEQTYRIWLDNLKAL